MYFFLFILIHFFLFILLFLVDCEGLRCEPKDISLAFEESKEKRKKEKKEKNKHKHKLNIRPNINTKHKQIISNMKNHITNKTQIEKNNPVQFFSVCFSSLFVLLLFYWFFFISIFICFFFIIFFFVSKLAGPRLEEVRFMSSYYQQLKVTHVCSFLSFFLKKT